MQSVKDITSQSHTKPGCPNGTPTLSPTRESSKRKDRFKNFKAAVRGCLSPIFTRSFDPRVNEDVADNMSDSLSMPSMSNYSHRSSIRCVSAGFSLMGYTFVLQLGLHLTTFLLNGLAFRRLDTASLGLVNVRLALFYSTLMSVARDSFRRACLSRGGELTAQFTPHVTDAKSSQSELVSHAGLTHKQNSQSRLIELLNLSWMVLPVGVILASVLFAIWAWLLPSPESIVKLYGETSTRLDLLHQRYINCLLVYVLSGIFELATEPFWLVCQLCHLVRERIFIEGLANGARALGILIAVSVASPDFAMYSLALPQILHGTALFTGYVIFFRRFLQKQQLAERSIEIVYSLKTLRDLFPRIDDFSVDRRALDLTKSFFGQGLLKQLLTEGERYLISSFNLLSFTDQGIYDMINNIGSIPTRLLFLPMEESCHFVFNQCLDRNVPPNLQDPVRLDSVFRIFSTSLRTCSLVAWIGITFAQANSQLLLFAYAGPVIAGNSMALRLLRLYAIYVLLLAWNGSTEAFLNAAMSSEEVNQQNSRLVFFSVVFLASNWLFVPWLGAFGLLAANCVIMICRVVYSSSYINRFLRLVPEDGFRSPSAPPNECAFKREPSLGRISGQSSGQAPGSHFSLLALMFPSSKECIFLILSLLATLISESFLCCSSGVLLASLHALVTTISLGITLWVMHCDESYLIGTLQNEIFHRKTA